MMDLQLEQEHGVTVARRRTAEALLFGRGPYAQLLRELVEAAKKRRASDIHIEPNETGVDVRFRIDGNLLLYKRVAREHRESLLIEAKRVFGLSIGISGRPQDERVSFPGLKLDLRVSLLPTYFGETIVLRLLDLESVFSLESIGLLSQERRALESISNLENGVVVVSGPTGSGKTKTLYSILSALGPNTLNIVTLEDPIEFRLPGLNQVQVGTKMSFADALRSVLRQDPDVILVGEVRDAETAKLCFQAAETGHLVLTTLHANGALEAEERLVGLGVNPVTLRSSLRLSIAQRLEQRLCPGCARRAPPEAIPWFQACDRRKRANGEGLRTRGMEGCPLCEAGIRGRVPLLEWAVYEHGVKDSPHVPQTLKEARVRRALKGEIDCLEVMR